MGIINSNKSIGAVTSIDCDGVLNVTLGITAAPDIISSPTDIVLVLDRSTSMQGQPLADMKTGVNTFIDIIANATGGGPNTIGSGSRIGIVSFASTATQNTSLITSVADLKAAAAALTADGFTNHGDAFTQATALLSTSTNSKVIVMFTDGETTTGPAPSPIAAAAKAQGIVIYCIGLVGSTGIDVNMLNDWATDPDITHVAVAPNSSQLNQIFADLAANISVPGATNIIINEVLNPDFAILSQPFATTGVISQVTANSFQWSIAQLGTTTTESATVSFSVRHIGTTGGTKPIDQSLTYSDTQGNVVTFADPSVSVTCAPVTPQVIITKAADKTSVCAASEDITYTLIVSNPGSIPLTDVILYDSIPQGLCYKPNSTRSDGGLPVNANPQNGIVIGTLNPATASTVTFVLNVCTNKCNDISVAEFINTAWVKGAANQTTVSAISDPWTVSFNRYSVSQSIEDSYQICDFGCYQHVYVYNTGIAPSNPLIANMITAGYAIIIKYVDRWGKIRSKYFEGNVIFSNLPSNFDYSSAEIRFVNLVDDIDCRGNAYVKFEAILCYCNRV